MFPHGSLWLWQWSNLSVERMFLPSLLLCGAKLKASAPVAEYPQICRWHAQKIWEQRLSVPPISNTLTLWPPGLHWSAPFKFCVSATSVLLDTQQWRESIWVIHRKQACKDKDQKRHKSTGSRKQTNWLNSRPCHWPQSSWFVIAP